MKLNGKSIKKSIPIPSWVVKVLICYNKKQGMLEKVGGRNEGLQHFFHVELSIG